MNRQQRRAADRASAKRATMPDEWTPLIEVLGDSFALAGDYKALASQYCTTESEVAAIATEAFAGARFFVSDQYEVTVKPAE